MTPRLLLVAAALGGASRLPAAEPAAPFPTNGTMTAGTDVPDGWKNKWEGEGKLAVSRDTTTYKTGPAALAVRSVGGRAKGQAQQFHDAGPGATVRFAGYLKTAGGITATAGVMSYSADWKAISFRALDQSANGADWHPFAGTVTLPDGTAHFAYTLLVEGHGTAWLDEVAGDAAAYQRLADAAKAAPRTPAGPHPDAPAKAPNAWTAGEGFYPAYPKAWRAFHESFVARAKKGDADLVFFGDSITQGLAEQKGLWAKYYAPRKAVDFGVGGDGTPQILWRLDHGTVAGLSPKAVVLMVGTNNRWRGDATPETIAKGIEAVVAKLREKLPGARVLVLGVFPTGEGPDHPDRKLFADTNRRLARLADDKTVFFLDVTGVFLLPDGRLDKAAMASDLLHLSATGYERWAAAMEPMLKRVLGE